ncbi:hypothetical protein [Lancefieldella rimae]|uniref:hypothetical protein n=1 Tax=Lancefieldella rimae TaxID=1383 RepID=UPI002880AB39|nr:hypothetical protein [Lancefieldella rimae]
MDTEENIRLEHRRLDIKDQHLYDAKRLLMQVEEEQECYCMEFDRILIELLQCNNHLGLNNIYTRFTYVREYLAETMEDCNKDIRKQMQFLEDARFELKRRLRNL